MAVVQRLNRLIPYLEVLRRVQISLSAVYSRQCIRCVVPCRQSSSRDYAGDFFVQKTLLLGLFSGGIIFGGAYCRKKFAFQEWLLRLWTIEGIQRLKFFFNVLRVYLQNNYMSNLSKHYDVQHSETSSIKPQRKSFHFSLKAKS